MVPECQGPIPPHHKRLWYASCTAGAADPAASEWGSHGEFRLCILKRPFDAGRGSNVAE